MGKRDRNVIKLSDLGPAAQSQVLQQTNPQTNARKVEADGIVFRSKAELVRWRELKVMEEAGEISNLRYEDITFRLGKSDTGRPLSWTPDFTYGKETCDTWDIPTVDEVKGRRFRDFPVRLALFRKLYPEYRVIVNGKVVT